MLSTHKSVSFHSF